MTITENQDGTRDLFAGEGKALRTVGSEDTEGVSSVHLTKWADPADWEEFDPEEAEAIEAENAAKAEADTVGGTDR